MGSSSTSLRVQGGRQVCLQTGPHCRVGAGGCEGDEAHLCHGVGCVSSPVAQPT